MDFGTTGDALLVWVSSSVYPPGNFALPLVMHGWTNESVHLLYNKSASIVLLKDDIDAVYNLATGKGTIKESVFGKAPHTY